MAGRLLIDTDVLIEYLRGRDEAATYLEEATEDLCVSVITVAELFAGIREGEGEKLEVLLGAFDILPVTAEVARLGGLYRKDYGRSHGTGLADALIAATSEKSDASLVTFNRRHFPMVPEPVVPYES